MQHSPSEHARDSAVNELPLPPSVRAWAAAWICGLMVWMPRVGIAQAGPPFLSNDPGTPGNGNWEINIAGAQSISRSITTYQMPQLDLNFGLGDRIQLTYEVPYEIQTQAGQPHQSA